MTGTREGTGEEGREGDVGVDVGYENRISRQLTKVSGEACEYNPTHGCPSTMPPSPDDCPNEAVVSVGHNGQWHLCETCAALPQFSRYRRRKTLKRPMQQRDSEDDDGNG